MNDEYMPLAEQIAKQLDDGGPVGFDIMIILSILAALAPMLEDCFQGPPEDVADAVKAVATPGRLNGYRWARFRVQRQVRREVGRDADRDVVSELTDAVMQAARDNPLMVANALTA